MRFQVHGSTIRYSHPFTSGWGGVTLDFNLFPSELGELKFSDGTRLMGCDLSENWGEPLTIGFLARKLQNLGYKDIDEGKFWPLRTIVSVTDRDLKSLDFLKEKEFVCGFAEYINNEYAHELRFWLSVSKDVFRDLLQVRLDMPGQMIFDIGVRGLEDRRYRDSESVEGNWDLGDKSDCGDGCRRAVTDFSFSREISFPDDQKFKWQNKYHEDREKAETKLQSMVSELVAIANGRIEGEIEKILRLCLILLSAIVGIGVLALILMFFR